MAEETLEELYGIVSRDVGLKRYRTLGGKYLECFPSPGPVLVDFECPEFTCLCPKTNQPDFATIHVKYVPNERCVEMKSLKYYLNSFRNEGHFHEAVIYKIEKELRNILEPKALAVIAEFNVRGGMYPIIEAGDFDLLEK